MQMSSSFLQEIASKDLEIQAHKSAREAADAKAAAFKAQLEEAALKFVSDTKVCSKGLLCCQLLLVAVCSTVPTKHPSSVRFALSKIAVAASASGVEHT